MSYTKAENILPEELLQAVQEYIDGHYLYIPRKKGRRKPWGSATGSKIRTANRNKALMSGYLTGVSVQELAKCYFITDKTVYKIIANIKYKK